MGSSGINDNTSNPLEEKKAMLKSKEVTYTISQPIEKKKESIKIITTELEKETNNSHNTIFKKKSMLGFCNIPKPLNNVSVLLNLTTIEKPRQYYHNNEDANLRR